MSNFETWWEREGQEFLYALNTTTDDDIKLVAEFAWKNGAYCAEQAAHEQKPVACNCGTNPWHDCNESEGCRIKKTLGISSRPVYDQRADHHKMMLGYEIATKYGVFENKAFQLCDEMKKLYAATVQQAEQEPVATVVQSRPDTAVIDVHTGNAPLQLGTKLYAAPVRTKDLTDDEVEAIMVEQGDLRTTAFARAVIAAYKEKNKCLTFTL